MLVLGGELLGRHVDAAHREPLRHAIQVRRRVEPRGDAVCAGERRDRARRRGLAVGTGDVDRGIDSCGSSSSVASCRIRARSGTIRDSLRPSSSASASSNRIAYPSSPSCATDPAPRSAGELVLPRPRTTSAAALARKPSFASFVAERSMSRSRPRAASTGARARRRGRPSRPPGSPRTLRSTMRAVPRPSASRPA